MRYKWIILLLCTLFVAACSEHINVAFPEPTANPRYLTISRTSFTFDTPYASQDFMNIQSFGVSWQIENNAPWLSIDPNKGNKTDYLTDNLAQINVQENTSSASRAAIAYLRQGKDMVDWTFEESIFVTQVGASPFVQFEQYFPTFSGASQRKAIAIYTNCPDIQLVRALSDVDWVSFSIEGMTLVATVEANLGASTRTYDGELLFTSQATPGQTFTASVSIRQNASNISASTSQITFRDEASVVRVEVDSEVPWTVSTSDSWIYLSPTEGQAGSSYFDISVAPNTSIHDRKGDIYLYSGSTRRIIIPITQMGLFCNADITMLHYGSSVESQNIEIESNTAWSVLDKPEWLDVSPSEGVHDAIVTISSNDNPSTQSRTGTIVIGQAGLELETYINVVQSGKFFNVSSTQLEFKDKAASQTLDIQTDGTWTASTSDSWISLSSSGQKGSASLIVSVSDNPEDDQRIGHIELIMYDAMVSVTVVQNGKYVTASVSQLSFNDNAGTQTVEIESNSSWTAGTEDTWISVNPTSATGDGILSISVTDNPLDKERRGIVKVVMNGVTLDIVVVQSGKYFNVDSYQLSFTSKGGVVELSIASNDRWSATIEDSVSWLSLSTTEGEDDETVNIIAADNPSLSSRSASILFSTVNHHSVRINILQEGRYLRVSSQSISFYAKGGDSELITISTDAQYSITHDVDWLSIVQYPESFIVTASRNTQDTPRSGKITISMTDLSSGSYQIELTVTQLNEGGSFYLYGYDEDDDWLPIGIPVSISLSLIPYSEEDIWDNSDGSTGTIIIDPYNRDNNFDDNKDQSDIGVDPYGGDSDWEGTNGSSGNVGRNPYQGDVDMDENLGGGDVGANPYDNPSDWDSGRGTGSIDKDKYTGDVDFDDSTTKLTLTITAFAVDQIWDRVKTGVVTVIRNLFDNDVNMDQ